MKIELVCPVGEDSAFLRSRAMGVLAALTPPHVRLALRDDIVRHLDPARDLDLSADLAAITVSSRSAARAYQLAATYRQAGVPVVLGGIHVTALPEEALEHADAIVVGEAEGLWQQVVADAAAGTLKRIYRHEKRQRFATSPLPRWELFRSPRYIPVYPVQASRGCFHACEFCSVSPFFGRRLRLRQAPDVAAEIERLDRRWVLFVDDDFTARPDQARRICAALAPLKVMWFAQASVNKLEDPALLQTMAAAGCKTLFIGFESLSQRSLSGCGKTHNDPTRYLEVVRRLRGHGIAVWGSFMFGLDDDGPDVFERTLEFAIEARLFLASFSMLTPYPGTPLYERLSTEGRLLRPRWWLDGQGADRPLFRPRRISPEELHRGWQWLWQAFYSGRSIAARLGGVRGLSAFPLAAFLPMNLLQRSLVVNKVVGGNRLFRSEERRA